MNFKLCHQCPSADLFDLKLTGNSKEKKKKKNSENLMWIKMNNY